MFDDKQARKDLKRFHKDGPDPTTRALIDLLKARNVTDATLLDIGGGVGAIHHDLLDAGARSAVQVDVSSAYLHVAREEAERRGHAERTTFRQGDFVELSSSVDAADVVTLDRVICCYADMEALVAASASRARRLYGVVFPRARWFMRIGIPMLNLWQLLRGSAYRGYLHPPDAIDSAIRRQGFTLGSAANTFVWRVAVYARA